MAVIRVDLEIGEDGQPVIRKLSDDLVEVDARARARLSAIDGIEGMSVRQLLRELRKRRK